MSIDAIRAVINKWEKVWHEGRLDLVPECVAPIYVRHEEARTRQVTPEEYALEIAATRKQLPSIRFVIYDNATTEDRTWARWTAMWDDAATGEKRTRVGMQIYRIEGGKLAETWVMSRGVGTAWLDVGGREHWTDQARN